MLIILYLLCSQFVPIMLSIYSIVQINYDNIVGNFVIALFWLLTFLCLEQTSYNHTRLYCLLNVRKELCIWLITWLPHISTQTWQHYAVPISNPHAFVFYLPHSFWCLKQNQHISYPNRALRTMTWCYILFNVCKITYIRNKTNAVFGLMPETNRALRTMTWCFCDVDLRKKTKLTYT